MNPFVIEENEPCLVTARQGFSVLYKNRWLYSRFEPEKAVIKQIESLHIQPETLILAFSPAAGYGLEQLLQSLPEHCHIITVEQDPYLFAFYSRTCPLKSRLHPQVSNAFFTNASDTPGYLLDNGFIPNLSQFRRIITITMSGGTDLCPDFYRQVTESANETLYTFWKNHLTLHHLGKLFNTNRIRNIPSIIGSHSVSFPTGTISKPILIIGAGPSAADTLAWLQEHTELRKSLYILAVDAAVSAVKAYGIIPDGVVAVESQIATDKAYIGWKNASGMQPHLFADCTSRPGVIRGFSKVSFFSTDFCDTTLFSGNVWDQRYISFCNSIGIPRIDPMGSVGNTAVQIALLLRARDIPVFVTGLDFSFSPGVTHAKNTPQYTALLNSSNRIRTSANYGAAWSSSARQRWGKNNHLLITDPNLEGYASSFIMHFKDTPLIFDMGSTGLPLGIPHIAISEVQHFLSQLEQLFWNVPDALISSDNRDKGKLLLISEKSRLEHILTNLSPDAIADCPYLFMHFPDSGQGIRSNTDFLKRIKAEATWFNKQVTAALQELDLQDH